MKRFDLSKLAFIAAVCGAFFTYGVAVGSYKLFPHALIDAAMDDVAAVWREWPSMWGIEPHHFVEPARHDGEGVTLNRIPAERRDLVLISGFFQGGNELRLLRRDGEIVARWPVEFSRLFPNVGHMRSPPATDWNIDTHGAVAMPDGSVVFNFEGGGLVKLGRCGGVVWTLERIAHHSVERAEGGGFWVAGSRLHAAGDASPFPPFKTPFVEDTVLKVSEDGKVLQEISVPGLFYGNGIDALLTATGHSFGPDQHWDREIVHLNKIEELTSDIAGDFPQFVAGDLALSIRELNLVMVFSPTTEKVKWWRIGPWRRQHDPEFVAGGRIVIFNNNHFRSSFQPGKSIPAPGVALDSNILAIDPATGDVEVLYGSRDGQRMRSIIRGKVDIVPDGGLLITEFEAGRIFEVDAEGTLVWEYINRYDADRVVELTEARHYPEDYFEIADWSCEPRS